MQHSTDSFGWLNYSINCGVQVEPDQAEANSALIAAAPDLLAAIDSLMNAALDYWERESVASTIALGKACEVARAAIAKAEGL